MENKKTLRHIKRIMRLLLCPITLVALLGLMSLTATPIYAESEEVTIETAEDNMGQPMVLDPDVAEEIRKEKEEERLEKASHVAPNSNKTEDNIKPEIVVLYRPKLCKRQSNRGDLMVVHYTGWLAKSGRKFDTTIDIRRRYAPFEFVFGTGYVIKGWDKGLMDMCPGEKRKLIVPAALGYGKKGLRGTIPREFLIHSFLLSIHTQRRFNVHTTSSYRRFMDVVCVHGTLFILFSISLAFLWNSEGRAQNQIPWIPIISILL